MASRRLSMSEDQLMDNVFDLAKLRGLLVHHCRPARLESGRWATPIRGDKGFADLVIAGPGGVIFRELKDATNKPSAEQTRWLSVIGQGGGDAGLWRPEQWDDQTILSTLSRIAKPRAVAP